MIVNNYNSTYQHGFTVKRSCLTNLLTMMEMITKNVDDGDYVDLIYFHRKKTFGNVVHRVIILLYKLKYF